MIPLHQSTGDVPLSGPRPSPFGSKPNFDAASGLCSSLLPAVCALQSQFAMTGPRLMLGCSRGVSDGIGYPDSLAVSDGKSFCSSTTNCSFTNWSTSV